MELIAIETPRLKSFVGPWTRKNKQLLLACSKCQRKLKDDGDEHGLAKLKKLVKKRGKALGSPVVLVVILTKCLKVCPRRGVAVVTQEQMGAGRGSILRTTDDLDLLIRQVQRDALSNTAELAQTVS